MRFQHYRRGFTFIELLFVIVILGIVGGIALEAVRQYYEGIYRTQEYSKRVAEADHILEQLSKYFENAISSSIVNLDIDPTVSACYGPPELNTATDFTVAFIGVDNDSMYGISGNVPGWSEETSLGTGNVITALDANYTMADSIIAALGSTLANSAIYDADSVDVNACTRFGLDGGVTGSAGYHRITGSTETTLSLHTENNATDGHRKYLLRTGYAFRVDDDGNFTMYTNFRPWEGAYYTAATKQNILGRNVAHFYADYNATDFVTDSNVSDRGLVWRLKVCMRGVDANLSTSDAESQAICRERRVHVRY
ncbi:MAG: prepilin-type N-terminal cleavage/methylation domain-containing protein [Sulfuricurvum sp.]|nr:prepilin-type N-terminal cleavage/methylation domain-containing protein [Sulfuricurvum sp.]MDD5386052.1 prepilin-type N-terminal cleavage/methylation domain-containing protein [Sulfuricurvum sp.]